MMKRVIVDCLSKLSRHRVSSFHSIVKLNYTINRSIVAHPCFSVMTIPVCDFRVDSERFSHDETGEEDDNSTFDEKENGEEDDEEKKDFEEEGDEVEDEGVVDEVEVVKAENEDLKETVKELKNSYARAVADRENSRRIAQEDVKKATNYAISSFAVQICDISDNLTMATQSIENILEVVLEQIEDEKLVKRINSTFRGIEMTNQLLQNTLVNRGITPMECEIGEDFNPEYQSAVFKKPTEESFEKANTVAEVVKSGYFIQDRVLRASQVVVFVEGEGNDNNISSDEVDSEEDFQEEEEEDFQEEEEEEEEEPKMI